MVKYLPTNFEDDIINTEINGRRKYRMIQNDDGTVSFEDVTNYLQEGSAFGAKEINNVGKEFNQLVYNFHKNFDERDPLIFETAIIDATLVKYAIYKKDENAYDGWDAEVVTVNKKMSHFDDENRISGIEFHTGDYLELFIDLKGMTDWNAKRCYPITVQYEMTRAWNLFREFEIACCIPDKNMYGNSTDTEPFKYMRILVKNNSERLTRFNFTGVSIVAISNRYFI